MTEKRFTIYYGESGTQSVSVTGALGRILLRDEVKVIANGFGSEVKTYFDNPTVDIVPPIPADRLEEFGQKLVSLAWDLDPTEPRPRYQLT